MNKLPLLVSFFAGPGSGKSTMCADVFAKLKWKNVNCEMALEYAKDRVWDDHLAALKNQLYIFGKQYHRTFRLKDKVDVILTDSPLPLSCIYDEKQDVHLKNVVMNAFNDFNTYNIFVERKKSYNPKGRTQTYEQACEIDRKIHKFLNENHIKYSSVVGVEENVVRVARNIFRIYEKLIEEREEARKADIKVTFDRWFKETEAFSERNSHD